MVSSAFLKGPSRKLEIDLEILYHTQVGNQRIQLQVDHRIPQIVVIYPAGVVNFACDFVSLQTE